MFIYEMACSEHALINDFINLRYEDTEDEPIDDEPVEFLEAEGRKRPKRPTNIKFNPFDDPLDFVPRLLIKGY